MSQTGGSLQRVYVTASRRRESEDRAPGEPRAWQRPHSGSAPHATPDRQQVAPAVLHPLAPRPRRPAAWRASSPLFPPVSWLRSRRWLVSYHHVVVCPWLVGPWPTCAGRRWPAALLPGSAAPRSGAGLARTHYAPGAIVVGSFHVTGTSPAGPARSSICTSVAGKVQRWGRAITCSHRRETQNSGAAAQTSVVAPSTRSADLC